MNWLEKWWKTVTTEEYELTVWFVDQTVTDAEGNVTANKSKKVFSLSHFFFRFITHGHNFNNSCLKFRIRVSLLVKYKIGINKDSFFNVLINEDTTPLLPVPVS